MAKNSYYLGTAVKITVLLNIETPTSAQITIEDPSGLEKVSRANMTKEADKVYSYIYQSDDDDNEGTYVAVIEISYGSYTSMSKATFDLSDITAQWQSRH